MLKFNEFEEELKFEDSLVPTEKFKLNASLVKHDNRYFCAYRSDHMHDYDPRNYLTELDNNLQPISHKRLLSENGNTAFEDIRLFTFKDSLLAIYAAFERLENSKWDDTYNIEIALVNVETGMLVEQNSLKSLSTRYHNKNWVPYISGEHIYIITDFDPELRILQSIRKYGFSKYQVIFRSETAAIKWEFGELRGGTPFLPNTSNDNNWQYSFVHSSLYVPNGDDVSRFYFYTVVRFNHKTKTIQYYKKPLNYSSWHHTDIAYNEVVRTTRDPSIRVVFPMGLAHWKDGLLVSFGKDDCVSRLKFYSWEYLLGLFITPGI
jgi:hypothetical protein